jgi:hypothetical protein
MFTGEKMNSIVSVDALAVDYLRLRGLREVLKQQYVVEDGKLEVEMTDIEDGLLVILNQSEAGSISTDTAVVIRRVSKRYNPTDWSAIYQLVDKYKAYGLLFKRINDANMSTFLEEHPDEYPTGLNVDSKYAVTVRRKSIT